LTCYDKKIIKGNNLKIEICEVARGLELNPKMLSNAVFILKTAIQKLSGYKFNEQ
jgi:hypothetical protein